ncbi:MAG: glycine/sarcosine/betaine reductase selenoprotein B family protein [Actinomycetota bacterium]
MSSDQTTEPTSEPAETFEEFRRSFSYGSRTDLDAKFLAALDDADAGRFFQELIREAVAVADGTDERARTMARFLHGWQQQAYSRPGQFSYDDAPFAPLSSPLSKRRVALLTSSGHFLDGDDPKPFGVENMTQAEAIERIQDFLREAPSLSHLPPGTTGEQLRVRHGGYPIEGAQADHNVGLPIDHFEAWGADGTLGEYAGAYSFVGACSQVRLNKQTGPEWVEQFLAERIEAVFLVPL